MRNFLFVDRIFEFEPNRSAKGIKFITSADYYLKQQHFQFPSFQSPLFDQSFNDPLLLKNTGSLPALSSCIIGEALGQLTAWIVMHAFDFKKRPVAGIVDEVKIYRDVYLGETLILHTEIENLDTQSVLYNSYATVCGETVFSLKHSMGPLLPMEEFICSSIARAQFKMIYRLAASGELASLETKPIHPIINTGSSFIKREDQKKASESHLQNMQLHAEKNEVYEKKEQTHQENLHISSSTTDMNNSRQVFERLTFFDRFLQWDATTLIAQKNISILAPYFMDHFPRKPVLPLTLLLEGKLELADVFLQHQFHQEKKIFFRPSRLYKIRMKQFIFPGDSIIVSLKLKEKLEQGYLFSFKTMLEEKTICSLEAIFELFYTQRT